MRSRFLARLIAAVFVTAQVAYLAVPASAEPGSWIEPPKQLPNVARGDRTQNLDFLFGALKLAPDDGKEVAGLQSDHVGPQQTYGKTFPYLNAPY